MGTLAYGHDAMDELKLNLTNRFRMKNGILLKF